MGILINGIGVVRQWRRRRRRRRTSLSFGYDGLLYTLLELLDTEYSVEMSTMTITMMLSTTTVAKKRRREEEKKRRREEGLENCSVSGDICDINRVYRGRSDACPDAV